MLHRKKSIMAVSLLMTLFFLAAPLSARTGGTGTFLEKGISEYNLCPETEYMEDPDGIFLIGDVSSGEARPHFRKSSSTTLNLGFSPSAWWFRIPVTNEDNDNRRWLLELGYPLHDHIELYVPDGRGGFAIKTAGDTMPFNMREVRHRNFLFNIFLERGQSVTLFLRIKSDSSFQVPLKLWEPVRFSEMVNTEQFGLGLYYGIMLVMILYNLFLFFGIREKTYLLYVVYISVLTIAQMSLDGLAFEYLWPMWPWWAGKSLLLSLFGSIFFLTLFGRDYLQTRDNVPRIDRLMILLAGASFIGMILSFTAPYAVGVKFVATLASLLIIPSPMAAYRCWQKKVPSAQYYLIAFIFFLFGVMCIGMRNLGLLPSVFLTTYSIQIGAALQVILLSLGLADRFNTMKREKFIAQKETLETQEKLVAHLREMDRMKDDMNRDLEIKVEERTSQLHTAMDEMTSINEELTRVNSELEKAHRSTEIDMLMASNIQKTLFPAEAPQTDDWDIAYLFRPMSGVSGDLYDFYERDGNLHGALLFDVSGHGVASGLITMIARTVLHRLFYKMREQSLNEVINRANQDLIREIGRIDNYLTGIILRFEDDKVEYVNAAHPNMYLRKGRSLNVHTINKKNRDFRGYFMGLEAMEHPYDRIIFRMDREDTLLFFTDGLIEARSEDNTEKYGTDRLQNALSGAPRDSASLILEHLMKDFTAFTGDRPPEDDLTMIIIRRK